MKDNSFYGLIGLFLLMFSIKEILNQCEVQNCKQCESNNNTLRLVMMVIGLTITNVSNAQQIVLIVIQIKTVLNVLTQILS